MCTRNPRRRSASATSALPGAETGVARSRLSSVAHTTSPARRLGETAAHSPTTATAGASTASPRAAAIRARAGPIPARKTVQPSRFGSIAASIRSGTKTSSSSRIGEHAPERHDGEDLSVEVIVEIEVAREARPGEVRLVPASVAALCVDEPPDGALDRRPRLAGCVEGEQRPRGLRSRRSAAATPTDVAVRPEILAEAAVVVLHALQPADRGAHALVPAQAGGGERRHRRTGPVEVV